MDFYCLGCGSSEIDREPIFARDNLKDMYCECLNCGKEWDEIVDIKVIE